LAKKSRKKKNLKKKSGKQKPGLFNISIPPDVAVKDAATVQSDENDIDECRLPGTSTSGEEADDE